MIKRFNIRVYGILTNKNQLLVSKEHYEGKDILKLPGGGLEFGESVIDCLYREIKEELGVNVIKHQLFQVSEEFIQSVFREDEQVVLLYYKIKTEHLNFSNIEHEIEWVDMIDSQIQFTFKQERDVFEKLKAEFVV